MAEAPDPPMPADLDPARPSVAANSTRSVELVLGGARSGKSRLAQDLAEASGLAPVYLATGSAGDGEMAERIALHQADRGPRWALVEEPLDLAGALTRAASADRIVLVDCLTLWLSNLMFVDRDLKAETATLIGALAALPGPALFVSNEVGLGIVPDNALARRFRDAQGRLNQDIARVATRVVFVAAGLPLVLKGPPWPADAV